MFDGLYEFCARYTGASMDCAAMLNNDQVNLYFFCSYGLLDNIERMVKVMARKVGRVLFGDKGELVLSPTRRSIFRKGIGLVNQMCAWPDPRYFCIRNLVHLLHVQQTITQI